VITGEAKVQLDERSAPRDFGPALDTFLQIFYRRERAHPGRVFLRQPRGGKFHELTYGDAGREARRLAAALRALGLRPGDRVGLLSKNCSHWILADLAILMAGCVSVPYYPSLSPAALREVIQLSDIRALFVGKLDAWDEHAASVPVAVHKIAFPHYPGSALIPDCLEWQALRALHPPLDPPHQPGPHEVFTIIFTSGTSGAPKGVVLGYEAPRQLAVHELLAPVYELFDGAAERLFSYLPLNHVAERFATEIACIFAGGSISFGESIERFADNLRAVQPSMFFAVPRILTKMQQGVLAKIPAARLAALLQVPLLGALLARTLRRRLGLGRARVIMSGAAPLPRATLDWFASLGILIQEVYGMSETGGGVTFNARGRVRAGTVGKPISGAQVELDPESGEITIRTPWMMKEYFRDPALTARVLSGGFIRSGDRGRWDAEGNLEIIGRVADAFKSAKGEFVVPSAIEARFAESQLIEHVLVTGRGLPQPLALVCLSELARGTAAAALRAGLLAILERVNEVAAQHERLHCLVVLSEPFSLENQLLTPTLKLRRQAIDARYEQHYARWAEQRESLLWADSA
jgi:long-chain acyl-CoA synthetase